MKVKGPFRYSLDYSFGHFGNVVGIVAGAVSVFNLLQVYLDFGLSEIFEVVLDFYQRIFHRALDIVFFLFPFELNSFAKDLIVIYLIVGASIARIYVLKFRNANTFHSKAEIFDEILTSGGRIGLKARMDYFTLHSIPVRYVCGVLFWFVVGRYLFYDQHFITRYPEIANRGHLGLQNLKGFFHSTQELEREFPNYSMWNPQVTSSEVYSQYKFDPKDWVAPSREKFVVDDRIVYVFNVRVVFFLQVAGSALTVLLFVLLNAGV